MIDAAYFPLGLSRIDQYQAAPQNDGVDKETIFACNRLVASAVAFQTAVNQTPDPHLAQGSVFRAGLVFVSSSATSIFK